MRFVYGLLFLLAMAAAIPLRAAQATLTLRDVDEAILIGQTRIAADRARFHEPYRIIVSQPPIDFVDVITPYRRVVLAADQQAQLGDRSFGQRQALELLRAAGGRFDVVIELTFHPLNTFVAMPAYEVTAVAGGHRVAAVSVDRQPRFGPRVDGLPPPAPVAIAGAAPRGSQPLLGGTLIARVPGEGIDPTGTVDLTVSDEGRELGRVSVDLGKLR